MIIVIDGLSGSGKSSTAKAVADNLDIQYLDSGALYRAVTFIWLTEKKSDDTFFEILTSKDIRFEYKENRFRVFVDSKEVSKNIRNQEVADQVSHVAAMPVVRNFVNDLMRKAVENEDFIGDGRDLGSVVFPDADLKFYMKASLDIRAERRLSELISDGENVTLPEVKENLRKRDEADQNRTLDPLVKTPDAHEIDTSEKTFDEQVKEIVSVIREKLNINQQP